MNAPTNLAYTRILLTQGTAEWREWRHRGIGASDAPIIMGENPYETIHALLETKRSPARDKGQNAAMARGTALEPEARAHFCKTNNIFLEPACLQSTRLDFMRASLDGISADGSRVVEIKCGESVYRKTAAVGYPPRYYYGQLQHVLAITGLPEIEFYCYQPYATPIHLTIPREQSYIDRLFEAEVAFWESVRSGLGV